MLMPVLYSLFGITRCIHVVYTRIVRQKRVIMGPYCPHLAPFDLLHLHTGGLLGVTLNTGFR